MNLLAVIESDDFKRDANRALENLRAEGGKGTIAPHFDVVDGQIVGCRFVVTSAKKFYSSSPVLKPPSKVRS